MHPCIGWRTHAPNKWLAPKAFKRNTKKRFRGCKECNDQAAETSAKYKAALSNSKARREAKENLFRSKTKTVVASLCYFISVEELETEEEAARMRAATALASAKLKYPGCIFSINVFGASTGSLGYSVQEEGRKNLTSRGYHVPPIVVPLNGAAGSSAGR